MTPSDHLIEVLEGYSEVFYGRGEVAYFKHPTILDALKEKKEHKNFEQRGIKAGLRTEEELLDTAYSSGRWAKEKEFQIKDLIFSNDGLRKILAKGTDPSIRSGIEQKIEKQQKEIDELKGERSSLVSSSLENYILVKSTLDFCSNRLFADKEFTQPIEEIGLVLDSYNLKLKDLMNQDNLIKASFYPSFFDLFYLYGDSPYMILNRTGSDLTIFQKDLLVYGHILNQKIKMSEIPKGIKKDPIQLYNFDLDTKSGKPARGPDEIEENFNTRKFVERHGGADNLKAEHYLNG